MRIKDLWDVRKGVNEFASDNFFRLCGHVRRIHEKIVLKRIYMSVNVVTQKG